MARSRGHHGPGDDDPPESGRHESGGTGGPIRSVAHGEQIAAEMAQRGRPGNSSPPTGSSPPRPLTPDDIELNRVFDTYDKLGDEPPKFKVGSNDNAYKDAGAHTMKHHGYDVPMGRGGGTRTIEGRLFGDDPWQRRENKSFRWTDPTTMNRTINDYVSQNWETIRSDLATTGTHRRTFDAGHRVGEGFVNDGMFGAGPIQPHYMTTSVVTVRMKLAPGTDPPQPFILTAFPAGLW
jgi:hypothetical protein